ncbi:uncharacterized protein EV420DRAFT_474129 [Desarmillaria tabescens]|uniref:RING-type E3 ubiquitin transferase n=1 Tax=Armillaria tabescens TaxID=1929756 RepID=A0AA39KAQ5_ARMTA|nr:uncharacterized protein EV420DRAFT_474129 [Desarmillaria tabescens]KAK0457701.1 hypothetical protein EV420DRAFT_474129 [Desarmillaria tabescens]
MSLTLCKYFQRGACTKGSSCLFSHNLSAAKAAPPVTCPHFISGKCRYGDKCINLHTKGSPAYRTEHPQESPSIRGASVSVEADAEIEFPPAEAEAADAGSSRNSPPLPPEVDAGVESSDLPPRDQYPSESSSLETLVSASPPSKEHGDKTPEEIQAPNTLSSLPSPFNHSPILLSSDATLDGPAVHSPSKQHESLPCLMYAMQRSCTILTCRLPHFLTDHQYHLLLANPNRPTPLCNRFAIRGSCPDSSCVLRHALLLEECHLLQQEMQGPPDSDAIPAPGPAAPVCSFYSEGKCRNGRQCPYRHEGPPRDSEHDTGFRTRNNVCKYYLSPAGCKNGNSCTFSHEDASTSASAGRSHSSEFAGDGWGNEHSSQSYQTGNAEDRGNTSSDQTRSSKPCRYGKSCSYGDKCFYSHDSDPSEAEGAEAPEVPHGWGEEQEDDAWKASSWDDPGGASWDNPGGASWDDPVDAVAQDDHHKQPEDEALSVDGVQEGDQDTTSAGVDEHYDLEPPVVNLFNCVVKYGPGAIPDSVTTPFNTSTLLLSNLPPDVYDDSIAEMVQSYGTPVEIGLEPADSTARIKFEECWAAALAAQSLNGTEYQSITLTATVDETNVRLYEFARVSRTVKLTWTTPHCTAWFFYDSITEAKSEVDRLNKLSFQGKAIKAEFNRPKKNQKNSFSVQIHGLPTEVDSVTLKHSLEVHPELSIHIGPPSFAGDPVQRLQEELTCFGEVDNVEVVAYDGPDSMTTGFAHFVTACAAAKAVGALNGKVNASLSGLGCLGVKHTFLIRHNVDQCVFTPIQTEVESLRDEYKTCQILAQDGDDGTVVLRLFSPNQEEYTQARKCLDMMVLGEPLLVEGKALWDPYFDLASCQKQLSRLNKKHGVHIGLDFLNRIVRVCGPKERRLEAKQNILNLLELVHSQQFCVPLPQRSLHGLLNGGLEQLYDAIGATKVDMDLIDRTLLVRGSKENKQKAEEILQTLISSPEGNDHSQCGLCCAPPVNPVTLPCGHLYCRSCMHTLIRSVISPKFSGLKCVAKVHSDDDDSDVSECSAFIPHQKFMQILPKEEQDNLLESSFLAYLHERPDKFFYCPTPHCASVYPAQNPIPGAMLRCPTCSAWICPSCRVTFHEGLTCEQYKAVLTHRESKEKEQEPKEQEGSESRALVVIS